MFAPLEPKMWASHMAREKAAASAASGYPGGAITFYRQVGMNECESVLGKSFAPASLRDKLWEIDKRQEQARMRIRTSRRVQARMATERVFDSKLNRRDMAQQIHEDEGIIMGLERLWCIVAAVCPVWSYEAAIEGGHR